MVYFFTYKTTLLDSNKYYVGRHSTLNLNDGYCGSGKWVRSIKDKNKLKVEILKFFNSESELLVGEKQLIAENINNTNCMNFNNNSVGFSSGKLNPNSNPDKKSILSERIKGPKNPMYGKTHTEEYKQRLRDQKLGKPLSDDIKKKISKGISKARTGSKLTLEGRKKLSISRKQQIANNERSVPTFAGLQHKQSTKEIMSFKAKNKISITCEHCSGQFKPHMYARWHGDNCRSAQN